VELEAADYNYLRQAENRGPGRFERGDPTGDGYDCFEVTRIEL